MGNVFSDPKGHGSVYHYENDTENKECQDVAVGKEDMLISPSPDENQVCHEYYHQARNLCVYYVFPEEPILICWSIWLSIVTIQQLEISVEDLQYI